jgi:hypothetical protein
VSVAASVLRYALTDPRALGVTPQAEGLVIRELQPAEADKYASAAAAGFEAPVELFEQLMTPRMLKAPGVRAYIGEVDGQPVTTGLGVTLGSHVGIFNIATPPAHRGRGYGAAVTARAVADGLDAGATETIGRNAASMRSHRADELGAVAAGSPGALGVGGSGGPRGSRPALSVGMENIEDLLGRSERRARPADCGPLAALATQHR